MNRSTFLLFMGWNFLSTAQSYAPPAGHTGSTAIHMDSLIFTSWASGIEVYRGFVFIEDTTFQANGSSLATFGSPSFALGKATGNPSDVVSLGDSGLAILTFDNPITNGPGFDFAVFENSFSDDYLEFAFVEVSSDGERFVRFPNHSEVQSQVQIHGFGLTDTRRIHNLAGKYRAGFGTPFDLEDLKDSTSININAITHIKLVDVIGSIGMHATYDSHGNKINDPYSSPYESGGFDLDGVGVIHKELNIPQITTDKVSFFPNPAQHQLHLRQPSGSCREFIIYSLEGKKVQTFETCETEKELLLKLPNGMYYITYELSGIIERKPLIISNQF